MVTLLKEKIINGEQLTKEDALNLINADYDKLTATADDLRKLFCQNEFSLCSIINGKSGRCSEDCQYCAQSCFYATNTQVYDLLSAEEIIEKAKLNANSGIQKFSIVTSGKNLSGVELEKIVKIIQNLKSQVKIEICASHGLLSYEQFVQLKEAGLSYYHNNLESSRRYFAQICSTHTYDQKISTIKAAQKAGLTVCSGGIIGMGETFEDRIDLALQLRDLNIKSTPINLYTSIAGTPLASLPRLSTAEFLRTVAIFRFILPDSFLRLAGGRGKLIDKGKKAFSSGANGAITGAMLTTSGISVQEDLKILKELNYSIL